ncbi:MAG: amidohydrolase, partial [Kiloniellales bacterium]|nr:amidohydrolase [Kiloniellales bacterium]
MASLAPDLILYGGKIATMDREERFVSALAVQGGRIAALGEDEEIRSLAAPGTKTLALEGRTAIPGIIDSHAHPDSYAGRIASWEMVSP